MIPESAQLRGIDDESLDGIREYEDDAAYEVYRTMFARMPGIEVIGSVARSHYAIYQDFLGELQSALALLYDSLHENARITGYIRGYRAMETYTSALSDGIVKAFAAPYSYIFTGTIRPRDFFARGVLEGLKVRVWDEGFRTNAVRLAIQSFFQRHHKLRNEVAHGLHVPTHDELRAMLLDAKAAHDLADAAINPSATHPLAMLDAQDYSHDDYRL